MGDVVDIGSKGRVYNVRELLDSAGIVDMAARFEKPGEPPRGVFIPKPAGGEDGYLLTPDQIDEFIRLLQHLNREVRERQRDHGK